MQKNEIILYHPEGNIAVEVRMEDKMVWLSRQQMARLFDRDVKTIGKHISTMVKSSMPMSSLPNLSKPQKRALY